MNIAKFIPHTDLHRSGESTFFAECHIWLDKEWFVVVVHCFRAILRMRSLSEMRHGKCSLIFQAFISYLVLNFLKFKNRQNETSDFKEDVYSATRREYHIVRGQWLLREKQWFLFFTHFKMSRSSARNSLFPIVLSCVTVLLLSKH